MLRRQLLALFWHEPLSVAMVKSRRVFSWAKNIMPALNKALPPALKRRVLREHADDALRGPRARGGTNCYVVGCGPRRVLVDAGEGRPAFGPALAAALRALDCTVDRVVITHRHFDHTGGIAQIRDMLPGVTGYDGALVDGERIVVDDETTLRVWHTPGHCEDHACFLLEEERAIFSGDNVLGAGSSWFEDLATYMRTLNDMLRLAEGEARRALPGHGPPSGPAAKIRSTSTTRARGPGPRRARRRRPHVAGDRLAIYPKLPPYLTFARTSARLAKRADGVAENRRFDLWARVAPREFFERERC
ncbi:hydroxyacylglutathione hydrolase [Aureococcus anophagefferens]|nr:hydroxyacylglutathione hydrolase [Aureococcus anophagefferens]